MPTQPLFPIPDHLFVNDSPRRCTDAACCGTSDGAAVAYRVPSLGHRAVFACAACGVLVERDTRVVCPSCGGPTRIDAHDRLVCNRGRCRPIVLPTEDDEPVCAWESAFDPEANAAMPEEWGLGGADTFARYHGGGLALRFGREHRGEHVDGSDDITLEALRVESAERIVQMTAAIDTFGEAVQADPLITKGGTTWFIVFGGAMALLLVNAIVRRGGDYEGITDLAHLRVQRTTPFAGYRHALGAACGYAHPEATSNGRGAGPLAYASDNPFLHGLPGGILMQEDGMSVNPSRNGASASTTSRYSGEDDVIACLAAARIGGLWSAVVYRDDGTVERPAVCSEVGAFVRPLTATERKLLELVDVGAMVPVARGCKELEHRRLKVGEALTWLRGPTQRDRYPDARHLLERDAKAMLGKARRAVREAMHAWRMIPEDEPRQREAKAPDPDAPPRARAAFEPTMGPAFGEAE